MQTPGQIVRSLLEDDEIPANPDDPDSDIRGTIIRAGDDIVAGKVTSYTKASTFWHKTALYSDGVRPIEVRRNGKTRTWARRPDYFEIPCKYGMYEYIVISPTNAADWTTVRPPDKVKPPKQKKPAL